MERPKSIHFHKPTAQAIYAGLLATDIAILILFVYLSYLAYYFTVNSPFFVYSYIIISPVFVAMVLFTLLLIVGKKTFYRELEHLKKYKVKI